MGESITYCVACNGRSYPYCEKQACGRSWQILRCKDCGHGYVQNRPTREFLTHVYAQTSDHVPTDAHNDDEMNRDASSLVRRILELSEYPGYSLDIGSGSAVFSRELAKFGYSPVMIDLDPRAEKCAANINCGEFHSGDFESFETERRFAAIVMSQVLEHALDPFQWIRHASSLLDKDGVLAVALPNSAGIYRVLGRRDPFLCPPIHLNFFTAKSLTSMLQHCGLEVLRIETTSVVSLGRNRTLARRTLGRLWNSLLNPIISLTDFGIILRVFACPASSRVNDR